MSPPAESTCPHCGARYEVPPDWRTAWAECGACGGDIELGASVGVRGGGLPSAGLLHRIPDIRGRLPEEHARAHALVDAKVDAEAAGCGARRIGSHSIGVTQAVQFGERFSECFGAHLPTRGNVRVNAVAVAAIARGGDEIYLVVPHSNLEPLPNEFFAILPGDFPAALALCAGGGEPCWRGEDGGEGGVARALSRLPMPGAGANWQWVSRDRKWREKLDWAMQIVPLGTEQFVVIARTAGIGKKGRQLGVAWFLEQLALTRHLRPRINVPGSGEARFPAHSESAELLARMFWDA